MFVWAATARTAGLPSGKIELHPSWKPLQGSASDHVLDWAPSPCRAAGSPDPLEVRVRAKTCKSPSGFHHRGTTRRLSSERVRVLLQGPLA